MVKNRNLSTDRNAPDRPPREHSKKYPTTPSPVKNHSEDGKNSKSETSKNEHKTSFNSTSPITPWSEVVKCRKRWKQRPSINLTKAFNAEVGIGSPSPGKKGTIHQPMSKLVRI